MFAGAGPALDGETLFAGLAGSCGWLGGERALVPGDGGAVWRQRRQCREMVAALARDRKRGGQTDGRLAAAIAEGPAGLAAGADRREAGPDLAGGGGRVGRARHAGELWRGVAFLQARRHHV